MDPSGLAQLAADPTAKGTITDDDPEPTLSVFSTSGNESDGFLTFRVEMSEASGKTVTVDWAASAESGDTATEGTDFTADSGTLTFNPGDVTGNFMVRVTHDVNVENDETFTVTLSNATNAGISDATAKGTITDAPPCRLNTGDLWCGVLTVGAISTSQDGFSGITGDLSDRTFSVGTSRYAIDGVSVDNSTSTNPGRLLISLIIRGLTTVHKAKLVLHVDSEEFAFSAAQYTDRHINHIYEWTGTVLDWSSTSAVTLRLRAPNNAPVFADAGVVLEVEENSAAGTDVGAAVTATDADSGDTLEYSLEGADVKSFDIDDSSGQIRTVSSEPYNHEGGNSFSVTVKASDSIASDTIEVTSTSRTSPRNRRSRTSRRWRWSRARRRAWTRAGRSRT